MEPQKTKLSIFIARSLVQCITCLMAACLGNLLVGLVIVLWQGSSGLHFLQTLVHHTQHELTPLQGRGMFDMLHHAIEQIPQNLPKLPKSTLPMLNSDFQIAVWQFLRPLMIALLLSIKGCAYRILALSLWCPLWVSFGVLGLMDGLTQRYIRRQSAGRESAVLYHHAKACVVLIPMLVLIFGVIFPMSITLLRGLCVLGAVCFGFCMQMSAKQFKKYL